MARVIPVVIDFESFWSTDHSLTKMSPIEYVMHPETEIISCAAKTDGRATHVAFGEEKIRNGIARMDWSDKLAIAHNMEGFDAMILAWRFGVRPKMWGCTLAMSRPVHAKDAGGSLAALVKHYNLGVKDQSALIQTKGRHLKDFTPEEIEAMRVYNAADVDQCWGLFQKLLPLTSKDEMRLIDMTVRMLVEPQFEVDRDLLTRTLAEERTRKSEVLVNLSKMIGVYQEGMDDEDAAGEVTTVLASAKKFSELLESLGVAVPTKISPTTGKTAPALAKTDAEFVALQEHENPVVSAAAAARLGVKSTLLESRIEAFLQASEAAAGKLPVPLKYYGADTTGRWSGWAYNPQNLPRIPRDKDGNEIYKPSNALRNCLTAGPGNKIVVADLSGIELRVNMFLWQVPYAMELFKADPEKADLYKALASELFGKPVDQIEKMERQLGKGLHLGCGFGLGNPDKFVAVCKSMTGLTITPEDAKTYIDGYRGAHPEIVAGWKNCHAALADIYAGIERAIDPWGLCWTCSEGIRTPKGVIRYPNLRKETNDEGKQEWVYGEGRKKARIYAGKVTENCLAAGTLVLTDNGWKPIELVGENDLVHDGDNFVHHAGTIFKSVQPCVTVDGVYMTADHEVLDEHGNWKEASQLPRPYRPEVRGADRLAPLTQRRKEMALDVQVSVRKAGHEAGSGRDQGAEAGRDTELRVPDEAAHSQRERNARHEQAPGLRRVAEYAGSVSTSLASSVEKLRRAWDNCLRTVAGVVREFLGGHGVVVPAWSGLGPARQQLGVLAGELSVGSPKGELYEQAFQFGGGRGCPLQGDRYSEVDAVLPTKARPVFDIVNAGPQQRFVVLGENGPFIVHNCVQHLARCVIADNALAVARSTGFNPALMVHDELVYVVPAAEASGTLDLVQRVMRTPPTWWPELITWSEGDIADTYGAAK